MPSVQGGGDRRAMSTERGQSRVGNPQTQIQVTSPMSDRMILQGYAQNENTLKT